jgi:hypothetical protein
MNKKKPRGRNGGRPKLPDDEKRVTLTTTIKPSTMQTINKKRGKESKGRYLDKLIEGGN